MKALKYLNKYLVRYKFHILLGTVFVIISNFFQIIPAPLVRQAIDLVSSNIPIYRELTGEVPREVYFKSLAFGLVIFTLLIILMALLRGFFLYLCGKHSLSCRVS